MIHRLEFYRPEEVKDIIKQSARILGVKIDPEAAAELSKRSRLTPRIANRLLKRVRDYADVNGDGTIDVPLSRKAFELLDIDELGLDHADRALLVAIIDNYERRAGRGGDVGCYNC